ncbi:putative smad nuclear-interacting protein 1-like [Apostichopus japonicus]|uniref:Putative smad nuclear-interacting protein 1-like n=1 Tax=Stichopus japonicus TaxID=307972 RepID=A0A2G8KQI2_STIJA|nr:putative smad nuclear-interacting protein 1-like [Apostichopus japonicus]
MSFRERDNRRDRKERPHKHERREKYDNQRERTEKVKRERRSRSPHGRRREERGDRDVKPRIKQEERDRGYERGESPRESRNENVRVKEEVSMNIKQEREYHDRRRQENRRHQPENPFQSSNNASASQEENDEAEAPKEREKPNFETSGALTEDTNTYRGVVIKYNEPPEARKPKRKWRFYIFKGDKEMPCLHVHRQSAYLLGRDRKIADIPVDHPSCSKQHAILQYRLAEFTRDDGTTGRRVRPYILDLESANGTFLNNQQIEAKRYYELKEKDVLKFAYSSRDYVLLHENSKDDEDEEVG